jgi:uncharacterized protein YegL
MEQKKQQTQKEKKTIMTSLTTSKHLIFCIDRSGSMSNAGQDAMYNTVHNIITQSSSTPSCVVTIITFDDRCDLIMEKVSVTDALSHTNFQRERFQPRGTTALYDAILLCLDKISDYPNTLLTVVTDGQDNGSQGTREEVKIQATKAWEKGAQGKFLGADEFAVQQGNDILNLSEDHILQYDVTPGTVQNASMSLSSTMTTWISSGHSPAFTREQRTSSMTPAPLRHHANSTFGPTSAFSQSFPVVPATPSRRIHRTNGITRRFLQARQDQLGILASAQQQQQQQQQQQHAFGDSWLGIPVIGPE